MPELTLLVVTLLSSDKGPSIQLIPSSSGEFEGGVSGRLCSSVRWTTSGSGIQDSICADFGRASCWLSWRQRREGDAEVSDELLICTCLLGKALWALRRVCCGVGRVSIASKNSLPGIPKRPHNLHFLAVRRPPFFRYSRQNSLSRADGAHRK